MLIISAPNLACGQFGRGERDSSVTIGHLCSGVLERCQVRELEGGRLVLYWSALSTIYWTNRRDINDLKFLVPRADFTRFRGGSTSKSYVNNNNRDTSKAR